MARVWLFPLVLLVACEGELISDPGDLDAFTVDAPSPDGGGGTDASEADASEADASEATDAGGIDAGGTDAGPELDAGGTDTGPAPDAGACGGGGTSLAAPGFVERISCGLPLLFDTDYDSMPLGPLSEANADLLLSDARFGVDRASIVDSPYGYALRNDFSAGECCYHQGFRAIRELDRVARDTYVHHFRMRFVPGFERSRGGKMGPSSNFETEGNGISAPEFGGFVAYMWRRPGLRAVKSCGPRDGLPSQYPEDGLAGDEEVELHAYINHRNMRGEFSDECWFADESGTERRIYEVGEWLSVVTRITVNDPGAQNGRVEIWTHVEGDENYALVLDESTFEWVTTDHPDIGIEKFSHNPFFGGSGNAWAPGRDSSIETADSTSWGF